MSKHMLSFTSIEARLKNYGITLTAIGPDDNEVPVHIQNEDIKALYGCNPASFLEKYENDQETLFELFYSVHGIAYAD